MLIHEIFTTEETCTICGLAMCPRGGDDKLAWAYTKNGEYSLRSGYHLANERFEVDKGSCLIEIVLRFYGRSYGISGYQMLPKYFYGRPVVVFCLLRSCYSRGM